MGVPDPVGTRSQARVQPEPPREAPVRAALVGAGRIGRWHARELRRAGGTMVAVYDADRDAAELLGAEHSALAYADLDELLAQAAPDVVHVCTPLSTHVELATTVLTARAHALVEKPIAPTAPETAELVALAEDNRVQLCPVHQYLFQPPMQTLAARLDRVAPLVHVGTFACSAGAAGRSPAQRAEIAAEILPHPLSALGRVLGRPVDELEWQATSAAPGELRAAAGGTAPTVSLLVSMAGRPTANELIAVGERGTLRVDFFHGFAVVEPGAVSRARKIARPVALGTSLAARASANLAGRAARSEPAYPGLRALIAELYASIRGDAEPPIAHSESLAVARARDHLMQIAQA